MKALLLVAHGSRRAESNQEIANLVPALRRHTAKFDLIDHAFLEMAKPSIPEGLQAVIDLGAQHITVVPYFLAAGTHVINDVPAIVEAIAAQHPQVTFLIAPHLGLAQGVIDLVLSQASKA